MRGAPRTSQTTHEYDGDQLVRTVTITDPEWTDHDRGLLLALLAEHADTCQLCGHPMAVCRDSRTAGTWEVKEEVCQSSRVSQAVGEEVRTNNRRGVVLMTRRTT